MLTARCRKRNGTAATPAGSSARRGATSPPPACRHGPAGRPKIPPIKTGRVRRKLWHSARWKREGIPVGKRVGLAAPVFSDPRSCPGWRRGERSRVFQRSAVHPAARRPGSTAAKRWSASRRPGNGHRVAASYSPRRTRHGARQRRHPDIDRSASGAHHLTTSVPDQGLRRQQTPITRSLQAESCFR